MNALDPFTGEVHFDETKILSLSKVYTDSSFKNLVTRIVIQELEISPKFAEIKNNCDMTSLVTSLRELDPGMKTGVLFPCIPEEERGDLDFCWGDTEIARLAGKPPAMGELTLAPIPLLVPWTPSALSWVLGHKNGCQNS